MKKTAKADRPMTGIPNHILRTDTIINMKTTENLVTAYDPSHEGNSAKYHTGKPCIIKGCDEPAGTAWGKYWCFKCNVKRMKDISDFLDNEVKRYAQFCDQENH